MKPSVVFLLDDNGQAVKQLTKEMRKITHVPVQTWNSWDTDWFTSWLLQWGWLRKGFLLFILFITVLLTIACFTLCLIATIRKLAGQVTYQQMMIRCVDLKEFRRKANKLLKCFEGGKLDRKGLKINKHRPYLPLFLWL
ncbi:hypothetical protein G0U57_013475 [Chelydra serpentina]|uniref:Uncharacterized protein n=1 Tax=Chelydra serpentina TaxID=8475 RepID=A0A8T1SAU6_CHESE|nr:hypothetical protein G0U57_013475 [Chelydra serpentina]